MGLEHSSGRRGAGLATEIRPIRKGLGLLISFWLRTRSGRVSWNGVGELYYQGTEEGLRGKSGLSWNEVAAPTSLARPGLCLLLEEPLPDRRCDGEERAEGGRRGFSGLDWRGGAR